MKRQILTYGPISGLIIIVVNTISIEIDIARVWLGYLVMLIAFSCIYIAIKQYRDKALGGAISFAAALRLGLGITVVASIVYVAVWELYLYITDYGFIEDYAASVQSATDDSGTVGLYSKPLFRLPITFLEVFPAGLLVSIMSAAILRNHRSAG